VNVLRGQLRTNRHGLQHPVASLDPTTLTIYIPERLLQDYVGQAVAAVMAAAKFAVLYSCLFVSIRG
jgi:hypothetical protein